MSDAFKPEADADEQRRPVAPDEADDEAAADAALDYPHDAPIEASDADVLEQAQAVPDEDRR